jgi:tryptophanyl-tRNA synthetase
MSQKSILTGDRPTGPLHLGHFVGSLKNRVALQHEYKTFVLIADGQALTDNFEDPKRVRDNIVEVVLDYLAVGIDPTISTIVLQTAVSEIQELAFFLANMTTVGRLSRNPTLKAEIQQRGFGDTIPAGFFFYPISQAADITAFRADLVPVGEDQKPMIELTNEIVDRFNRIYNSTALKRCEALIPPVGRLPGTDGKEKMSKSLGNAIFLGDSEKELKKKVQNMFTDPKHLRVEDPGTVEGNPVFTYLQIFDPDQTSLRDMEDHYRRGGLGDGVVKKRLEGVLIDILKPIREGRERFAADRGEILNIIRHGTNKGREVAAQVLADVKNAIGISII